MERPEWMTDEDWKVVQNLPASLQQASINLRSAMIERRIVDEATEQAAAIREEVAAMTGPEQVPLAVWCGYPTDLTRCSPFFPMNVRELGKRDYLEGFLITSANWGEITYTGPKLSTYEEDALMALLAVLDNQSHHRQIVSEEGRKTYTYSGPVLPLLKLLGYSSPNNKDYQRLLRSLKRLTVAGVELSITTGKTKSGKRRTPRIMQMSSMLTNVYWDEEKKELSVTVNPFFYETYYAGTITLVDVLKRVSLKGVIAKSLYRFVQSHRANPVFAGHFLTLADALNMDREQPAKKTRQMLKTAISELIRQGVLTRKSRFVEQDIIRLERTSDTLPKSLEKFV